MTRHVVLVGFMGTGKTSCGRTLATRLGCGLIDLDKYIEAKEGMSVPEIFAEKGEPYFREKEREAVREVVKRKGAVIATGGGTIKDEENFRLLKERGVLVCLTADIDTIMERTERRGERPMLDRSEDRRKAVEELLESRREMYGRADFTVDTSRLSPMQAAEEVMSFLRAGGILRA
ncbi:MAG: shikimate kinase [Schwartzia sp.]|nr:shikimate kinase [Schwartzia sp. (in: firmicutes)]